MRLERVRWREAVAALDAQVRKAPTAAGRGRLAEVASLSALFERDYAAGRVALAQAAALEPLNPVHDLRRALHDLAFGRWESAAAACGAIAARGLDAPVVPYLRALAMLLSGEAEQAKKASNVAGELAPSFAPAKLLHAEARLRLQFRGAEAYVRELDGRGPHRLAAVDLLAKMVAMHPGEAPKLVERAISVGGALHGAAEAAFVATILRWAATPADAIGEAVAETRVDSAAERLLVAMSASALERTPRPDALRALGRLHARFPERASVSRWYAAIVARHVVELAASERFDEALRGVELCIRLEPYEATHRQNRAALATLTRDHEGALDAWADFDRYQVRVALLGRLDPAAARSLRRTHRMFAGQARLPPRPASSVAQLGIFREMPQAQEESGQPLHRVNQERVDADPELLRQWIHHRAAELFYSHLALGDAPARFLLHPETPASSRARVDALAQAARSLGVLVSHDGELLAERVVSAWRARAAAPLPAYADAEPDAEVTRLRASYLETLGDFALLCLEYEPKATRRDVVEELAHMGQWLAPFFDERVLWAALDDKTKTSTRQLRWLGQHVVDLAQTDDPRPALTPALRARVVPALAASALTSLGVEIGNAASATSDIEKAIGVLERARELDPASAVIAYRIAQLSMAARFFDDAAKALRRVRELAKKGDEKILEAAEKLEETLGKRRVDEKGERRLDAGPGAAVQVAGEADLEADVARHPGAIRGYEALVRALLASGRAAEAIDWAEQAMRRCLTRAGQTRARRLHLEALGADAIKDTLAGPLRLFLAGSPQPLADALAARGGGAGWPYPAHYLHGAALLEMGKPQEAAAAFERARAGCGRQAHAVVLKMLAGDAEGSWFEGVRARVERDLDGGNLASAGAALAEAVTTCERKERGFPLAARLALDAALRRGAVTRPALDPGDGAWSARFRELWSADDGLPRARRLAQLAVEAWPAGADEARAILRRVDDLERQVRLVDAIERASTALQKNELERAIAALDAEREAGARHPQWLRLRVVALLRLARFDEADDALAALSNTDDARAEGEARELVLRYPDLAVRFRIAAATAAIGRGDVDAAVLAIAAAATTSVELALELAFTRGFVFARLARRARDKGDDAAERAALEIAVDALEPQRAAARAAEKRDLLDLFEIVDSRLAQLEGAPS